MGNFDDNSAKGLQYIYLGSTSLPSGSPIYSYSSCPACSISPAPIAELPCTQGGNYIEIPDNVSMTGLLSFTGVSIPSYSIRWFFFRFVESGNQLSGSYTIAFNTTDDSITDSSTITFSVP
jgi:hypothetical protein